MSYRTNEVRKSELVTEQDVSIGASLGDVAASNSGGMPVLVVRDDVLTTLSEADTQYTHLRVNNVGELHTTNGSAYAEDSQHTSTDTGNFILGVRNDAGAALATTPGDYIPLTTNSLGYLWCHTGSSVLSTDLAAIKTSVEIMDDWDESDRCAVNPIAGQIGLQGGSGVDTLLSLRCSLATDVALPTGSNAIGKLAANSGVDIGDVDVLTLPDITQATAANLNCTEASAAAILADTNTIAGAISGSEMQVDIVSGTVSLDTSSYGFSTTSILGIAASYVSSILDLRTDTQVQTAIDADQDGTITIEFCEDGAATNVVRTLVIPYVAANGFQLFAAPAFTQYVRYTYLNGGTGQADFYFATKQTKVSLNSQILGVEAFISGTMVTQLQRSILVGNEPVSDTYNNVAITTKNELLTNTEASNKLGHVNHAAGAIIADAYHVLIDLSDTTNFPHGDTGHLTIDSIIASIQGSTNSADATIKVGLITRIDGTDSDIDWVLTIPYSWANANTSIIFDHNYSPGGLVCDNGTPRHLTSDTSAAIAGVNTGSSLPSPNGNIAPGLGDILLFFDYIADTYTANVQCTYHSDT